MSQIQCKRAYTLIEMLAVLVMVLPLISLVSVMLRRSLAQYAGVMDQAFEMQAVEQWTQRFREEIHEANQASINLDGNSLTLTYSDRESTHYFQDGLRTSRQHSTDGRLLAIERAPWSSPLHFERNDAFRVPMIAIRAETGMLIWIRLASHSSIARALQ
jgi:type II secretory pathway pseudopilin PulG